MPHSSGLFDVIVDVWCLTRVGGVDGNLSAAAGLAFRPATAPPPPPPLLPPDLPDRLDGDIGGDGEGVKFVLIVELSSAGDWIAAEVLL